MNNFYLEKVSIKRKEDILDFLDEFDVYNSNLNGAGALDKVYQGYSFEEALDMCLRLEDEEYAKSIDRLASKTFLLIRKDDDKVVGIINIRWNVPKDKIEYVGNIGYSIRPLERRKGYNKINLHLGLIEAKKLGLDRVYLDCESNNIGSYKTIEALGGILYKEETDPYDGLLTKRYYIDIFK